jgi:hypothetical protein
MKRRAFLTGIAGACLATDSTNVFSKNFGRSIRFSSGWKWMFVKEK